MRVRSNGLSRLPGVYWKQPQLQLNGQGAGHEVHWHPFKIEKKGTITTIEENLKFNFGVVSQQKKHFIQTQTLCIGSLKRAVFNGVHRDAKDIAWRVVWLLQHSSTLARVIHSRHKRWTRDYGRHCMAQTLYEEKHIGRNSDFGQHAACDYSEIAFRLNRNDG